MMSRIGMLVERPSETEGKASGGAASGVMAALMAMSATDMMVPSLLPEFPPGSLVRTWGGSWSSGWPDIVLPEESSSTLEAAPMNLQLRRVYVQCERTLAGEGSATSMSVFGCTLSRLMQKVAAEPCVFWQHGACMAVQHELGVKGARVLVEQRSDGSVNGGQQPVLSVTVRSSAQALIDGNLAALWARIDDCVRSVAEQQPGCILASYVACPLCQARGATPYLFTTTQISEAWRDGERILLSPGIGNVPLELLQPPSFAEATDADKTSQRLKRVERVMKQLESHLSERILRGSIGGGGSSRNQLALNLHPQVSVGGEDQASPKLGNGIIFTDEQMDELHEKTAVQKNKYSRRMGFFCSDAVSAVDIGNPGTLLQFQVLVPKVLNRCHIPESEVAEMLDLRNRPQGLAKATGPSFDEANDQAAVGNAEEGSGVAPHEDLELSDEEYADSARQAVYERFAKAQVRAVGRGLHTFSLLVTCARVLSHLYAFLVPRQRSAATGVVAVCNRSRSVSPATTA